MTGTVANLVTPHLLRIIDLANQAETGVNVDWHVRNAVDATMADLRDQWNAPALVASYVEGLENAARQASEKRPKYALAVQMAAVQARGLRRD